MLRLSIIQSVNGGVLKLNINENRFLVKCVNYLKTRNGTIETKDTSKLQDTTDSDTDCDLYKQIKNKETVLQEQQRDSQLPETNELEFVNTSKIMVNIKSVSIFGSETVEDCRVQCIKDNEDLNIPNVTHILNKTMRPKVKAALERWKKNMIDIHGEEHFKTYCKGLLNNDKLFHSDLQTMLSKNETEIPLSVKSVYSSIEPILNDILSLHKIETDVTHPTLRYKSIINYIGSYRGQTYLINWRKSRKRGTSLAATYDAPIQIAACIGAINAFNKNSLKVNKGLIVVAYASGEPASIHELKDDALQTAWGEWLNRLEQFHANYNKDSLNN